MSVEIDAEITPSRLAELGQPAGAYRGRDLVALVSNFDRLYWPGRAVYGGHRIRHRVSLYASRLEARLGVFIVTADDDVLHPQDLDPVLEDREAVEVGVHDHVADVAVHERSRPGAGR